MIYSAFAYYYDELMEDTDYNIWFEKIEGKMKKYNHNPRNVLDLACGTGKMTEIFAKNYNSVTGVDISEDMLIIANEKNFEKKLKIKYYNQDLRELELRGKYDTVFCICDGLNYITNKDDLRVVFERISKYTEDSGYVVFDISSPYKLEHVLGNNTIAENFDTMSYIWENNYNSKDKILEFVFSMFVREESDLKENLEKDQITDDEEFEKEEIYVKYTEHHLQRAYLKEEIEEIVLEYFNIKEIYDTETGNELKYDSERWTFICQKAQRK